MRKLRPFFALLGQSLVLSVVLTWPVVTRLNGVVLGSPDADTMKHLWTLWWMRRVIAYDRAIPFATDYINFPSGLDLWPIEPLNGVMAAIMWPVPLVATANILALANLTLNGFFAGLLGHRLSRSPLAAHMTGLLLQCSAFSLFTIEVGVWELQHLWLLPLGFLIMLRLLDGAGWRWAALTGGFLALTTFACFYLGLFLALGMFVLGLFALFRRGSRLRTAALLLLAAFIATALVVPVVHTFSGSYGIDERPGVGLVRYVFQEGHGQPVTDSESARLEPADLVRGRTGERSSGSRELLAYGGGRLLGLPLLLAATLGLLRRPRESAPWVVLFFLGLLLAMGAQWQRVDASGQVQQVTMPFLYLNRLLGYWGEPVNFPVRFLALSVVAVVAVAAMAIDGRLSRRWRVVLAFLMASNALDVQARQLLPWPLPTFSLPDFSHLQGVSSENSGAVLDLPLAWRADQENRFRAMAAQMVHQHPIQAVPLERLEFFVRDGKLLADSLKMVQDLEAAWLRQPMPQLRDYRGDLYVLRQAGFSMVLVGSLGGRDPLPDPLTTELESLLGLPLAETASSVLYAIPEPRATSAERAAWTEEYALRLELARRDDELPGPAP